MASMVSLSDPTSREVSVSERMGTEDKTRKENEKDKKKDGKRRRREREIGPENERSNRRNRTNDGVRRHERRDECMESMENIAVSK